MNKAIKILLSLILFTCASNTFADIDELREEITTLQEHIDHLKREEENAMETKHIWHLVAQVRFLQQLKDDREKQIRLEEKLIR